ncbi:hypothetical protein Tco_1499790 [Tanacetum coccineum]
MATCSSFIDSKLKSLTSSTSPSTNGYLTSTMSPPIRIPPPPLTQESGSMDITSLLLTNHSTDIPINTPSPSIPSPPLFGHPISWNLLEAHGATCLCCIHNRRLILGLSEELQYKEFVDIVKRTLEFGARGVELGEEREKVGLRSDLEWVMRKAISRMLAKVLRNEQFNNEMLKVQKVLTDHLPRKAKDVVRGLKKIKWE